MLQIVKVLSFVLRSSRAIKLSRLAVLAAVVTGALSGFGHASLLAVINSALNGGHDRARLLYVFLALCCVVPICRLTSQALFNWISAKSVLQLRLELSRKILATPLRDLEILGPHRLFASLTEDVTAITTALTQTPALCMHAAIVIACLIYMGLLSPSLLAVVLAFMAVGTITYQLPLRQAHGYLRRMREEMDTLFAHFRGLIHGNKELKLHRRRSEAFFELGLAPTGESIRRLSFLGSTIFTGSTVWGNLLFFITIGLLVFGLPRWGGADRHVLSGYTLALLYMTTPLEVLLTTLPMLSRAGASAAKLQRLGFELDTRQPEAHARQPLDQGWRRLEAVDVVYGYSGESGDSSKRFVVGPLSLALEPGQITFVAGGNGSGKSTLAKILTGLYVPESGEIRLDGRPITDENRDAYRQLFSAVFSDFYLFESLAGIDRADLDEAAGDYLERLQLADKVKVSQGTLSTIDLSQGQRKRLALLTSYLEDRPIYLFDEWAADQDPHFKAVFYFELLPELKARGKAVVVISHDSQYYSLADRLIQLRDGRIVADEPGVFAPGQRAARVAT